MAELPVDAFRVLFTEHPLPMFVYDVQTLQILEVNGAAVSSYGYTREEFLAMHLTDIRPPEDVPALLGFLGDRQDAWFRAGGWRHRDKAGRIIDVEIVSHPVDFNGRRASLVVVQDITERRRLEAQLRHSQKMEALGRLAGGISHEFNNALTAILGFSTLLLEEPFGDRTRTHLEQIHKAAMRARSLTVQLLAFSRKQLIQPKIIDVNVLIDDLARMLRRLVGDDVETVVRLDPMLGRVKVDAGELAQVLTNLVINARDAMPAGGMLTVETANVELDAGYTRKYPDVAPGPYVMLAVTDSGVGIPADVQERMFEPFFTTKAPGVGTGLGLSTAYGIIRQRNGHIAVYSEPQRGTTFKIYLPRVYEETAPAEVPRARAGSPASASAATILVAEDDEEVRVLIRDTLERRGYSVLAAATPDEALRLAANGGGTIRLLVTDVIMPGLSGPELAQQLLATHDGLQVIFMSGFPDEAAMRTASIRPGAVFLQKPFTLAQLEHRVHELLTRT